MSTKLVPCPTGGKCGHKRHDPNKSEYAQCQKSAGGKGKSARSGGIAPVSDAVTPRPEFPRESLGGAYSICPACQASVHPDENSEKSHWTREHAGVSLTPDQLDEAQVFADRFRVERDRDLARSEQARAERRGKVVSEREAEMDRLAEELVPSRSRGLSLTEATTIPERWAKIEVIDADLAEVAQEITEIENLYSDSPMSRGTRDRLTELQRRQRELTGDRRVVASAPFRAEGIDRPEEQQGDGTGAGRATHEQQIAAIDADLNRTAEEIRQIEDIYPEYMPDDVRVVLKELKHEQGNLISKRRVEQAAMSGGETKPSPETSGFEMSEQHPLEYDRVSGWFYQMHCNSCGEYVDDSPARRGVPAVDYLCDDCEGGAE